MTFYEAFMDELAKLAGNRGGAMVKRLSAGTLKPKSVQRLQKKLPGYGEGSRFHRDSWGDRRSPEQGFQSLRRSLASPTTIKQTRSMGFGGTGRGRAPGSTLPG